VAGCSISSSPEDRPNLEKSQMSFYLFIFKGTDKNAQYRMFEYSGLIFCLRVLLSIIILPVRS